MKNLPSSETLAVFLGVSGFDWLINGKADLIVSLAIALTVGVAIYFFRRRTEKPEKTRHKSSPSVPPTQ
jgi:hypothetical protein